MTLIGIKEDRALKKKVKDRTEQEHLLLIKHFGGAREYLLSMGQFKEDRIEVMNEREFLMWLYTVIGDDEVDYMLEIDKRINKLNIVKD